VLGIYNNNNIYIYMVITYKQSSYTQNTIGSVWKLYTALDTLIGKL